MNDLSFPSARLRSLAPSCGPVRLIAVDGHAGSGKSTFTTRLSAALDDAPVLRLDDLATHESFFTWTGRLLEQVIAPLSRGERARYAPYDWTARRFAAPRTLEPAPVVLIEGVGAGRRALRPHLARLLWMDLPTAESWARGRRRDGPSLSSFWDDWTAAETEHFSADPSRPHADILIRQLPAGYAWLERSDPAAESHHRVTDGERPAASYQVLRNRPG
ncbi:uridine kinase [Streptomyces sp. NPDC056061]|uniref:uridine kinase family protein n=1 Tax=Streptomyces sp. NPDC056061 TaxID=3345700 RepID=UPI0035E06DD7